MLESPQRDGLSNLFNRLLRGTPTPAQPPSCKSPRTLHAICSRTRRISTVYPKPSQNMSPMRLTMRPRVSQTDQGGQFG